MKIFRKYKFRNYIDILYKLANKRKKVLKLPKIIRYNGFIEIANLEREKLMIEIQLQLNRIIG